MNKKSMLIIAAFSICAAYGQMSEVAMLKSAYDGIKRNLTAMADAMPDDQYGFKASPDIRTFGALMGHVADAQGFTCAGISGAARPASASSKTSKADLVSALKASFDLCDAVFDSLTDADSSKMIKGGRGGERSELGVLWGVVVHSNEEYGYGSVYLRLKGITPPSSVRR